MATDSAPLSGSQDGLFRHGTTPGGVTNGVAGLQSPTYLGLEATNTASSFNGAAFPNGAWDSGATDNIRVDTAPTLFGNVDSAEFWFNDLRPFNQLPATGYIFSRLDVNTYNSFDAVGLTGTAQAAPTLQFYNGVSSYQLILGSTSLQTGTWYDVVFVRNNTTISLYLNGVLDASGTANVTYGNTSNTFLFALRPGGSWPYQGLLDEVSVYNYALTTGQVAAHYNAAFSIPEPATLAWLGLAGAIFLATGQR